MGFHLSSEPKILPPTAAEGARAALMLMAVVAAVGCGSKTGLTEPDASLDAGMDSSVPCIELLPDGGPIPLQLNTPAEIGRADIVFLVDVTASMREEIDEIRNELRSRLVPGIRAQIPDSFFAVATFGDFPIDPFGEAGMDTPFELALPITDDITQAQAAVNGLDLGNGKDEAESQVEALYQLATGDGHGTFVPPAFGCPMGGRGYACLRDDAFPIVLLFTDAPFHNGPGNSNPYTSSITPTPHTYAEAIDALSEFGIRVIGFDSGNGSPGADLRQVATDTSALDSAGRPLVFDIGTNGERLGLQVIEAIRIFAGAVTFDVDVLLVDPQPADGIDVTEFVSQVRPVRATPMSGVGSIDFDRGVFVDVVSGTTVVYELLLSAGARVPGPNHNDSVLRWCSAPTAVPKSTARLSNW